MMLTKFLLSHVSMAFIKFKTMLECLQSHHSLMNGLLSGQEGLHYGDMLYMPMQSTLKMQHMPYTYFVNLVQENNYQQTDYYEGC